MLPAWVLTTIALRVWLVGLLLVSLLAASDFIFHRPHDLIVLVCPLALISAAERRALFGAFIGDRGLRS